MRIGLPTALSDAALIEEVAHLARSETCATARLVAHLSELDARKLHLAAGFPSLFAYCCEVLHLSEDAAGNRITAARVARRFEGVLDLLESGTLTLTAVRLLSSHLTRENYRELFEAAAHKKTTEVEELIAHRFPRPDVVSSVRKVPIRVPAASPPQAPPKVTESIDSLAATGSPSPLDPDAVAAPVPPGASPATAPPPATPSPRRARVAPLAPDRYEIRFTATAETRAKLRRAQEQLSHAVPSGDLAEIFDRALTALLGELARTKAAAMHPTTQARSPAEGSRHVPAHVKRAVWLRDGGQCAFVARRGRRCDGRAFLEFHHRRPFAVGGAATIDNIELRCRAHNAYEADLFYGPLREAPRVQESRARYVSARGRSARASPG